jgi:hypothetical protein
MAAVTAREAIGTWCAVFLVTAAVVGATSVAANSQGIGWQDYDGDGSEDMAIGVPFEGHSGRIAAGAVDVMRGAGVKGLGLETAGAQHWTLASANVGEIPGDGDLFGFALASGDFNGDVVSDLAIGIPGRSVRGKLNAGAVVVLYGELFDGLAARSSPGAPPAGRYFVQGAGGIAGTPEQDDRFGHSLISADFNGDGFDDLAIGAPGGLPGVSGAQGAGEVNVIYGSSAGLHPNLQLANQLWSQNKLSGTEEAGDSFGFSLAAGRWDRGEEADLAIGVPGEDIGHAENAGAVHVLYGGPNGLTAAATEYFDASFFPRDPPPIGVFLDTPQTNALFGFSLAGGDMNQVGTSSTNRDDLAIGEPFRDVPAFPAVAHDAGTVRVLYGQAHVLMSGALSDGETWRQGKDLGDTPEEGDYFGFALLARQGLAIGVPGEDVVVGGTVFVNAGMVHVFSGLTSSGLDAAGSVVLTQQKPLGVNGDARFGWSLGYGRFALGHRESGTMGQSLVVGAPGSLNLGGVICLFFYNDVFPAMPQQKAGEAWWQSIVFASEPSEIGDFFGMSLGAGALPGLIP